MDLLEDYYEQKQDQQKIVTSKFFEEKSDVVKRFCNNVRSQEIDLNLEEAWEEAVNSFSQQYPNVKVVKDFHMIDFTELRLQRMAHLSNNNIRLNSMNDLINNLTSSRTLQKLDNQRSKLKHVAEFHNQDFLYYSITDLTTSKEAQSDFKVLQKDQIKQYKKQYRASFDKDHVVFIKATCVLQDVEESGLKAKLKESKKLARNNKDKLLKKTIKVLKVYREIVGGDENLLVEGAMNENEYTFDFIKPIFKQVLYDCNLKIKTGEPYLNCASLKNNDDDRSNAGPKIDIIFFSKSFNLPISICEVSGPFNKTNKCHFLGDRNKLAKNMKLILRNIKKNTPTPDCVMVFIFFLNEENKKDVPGQ